METKEKKGQSICSGCIETFDDKLLNIVEKVSHDFIYRTIYCDKCCSKLGLVSVGKKKESKKTKPPKESEGIVIKSKKTKVPKPKKKDL